MKKFEKTGLLLQQNFFPLPKFEELIPLSQEFEKLEKDAEALFSDLQFLAGYFRLNKFRYKNEDFAKAAKPFGFIASGLRGGFFFYPPKQFDEICEDFSFAISCTLTWLRLLRARIEPIARRAAYQPISVTDKETVNGFWESTYRFQIPSYDVFDCERIGSVILSLIQLKETLYNNKHKYLELFPCRRETPSLTTKQTYAEKRH